MLKYSLIESFLTGLSGDYSAQTHSIGKIDKEAIITRMLSRGTLLSRTDILAVLNNLEEVIVDIILEGYTLNLPLFNTSFSISGNFEGLSDNFDSNRHKLNVNLTKGTLLRNAEKEIKLEKTNAISPQPYIKEVKDSISNTINEQLTSQGVIKIRGNNLKIEGDNPSCGLWFVNEHGDEIKTEIFIDNKPSIIIAIVPQLNNGSYQVKIVTQFSIGGKLLKTPKQYTYSKSMIVQNK